MNFDAIGIAWRMLEFRHEPGSDERVGRDIPVCCKEKRYSG